MPDSHEDFLRASAIKKTTRVSVVHIVVITLSLYCPSVWAGSILFSDLGPSGSLYNCCAGEAVLGSANSAVPGTPAGFAELFTVSGTGAENVSQIDLAVTTVSGLETFAASIWTDVGELPGAQVSGAYWSLSTNAPAGTCCSMVSVAVSGVTLTGGQQYFMVLRPASFSDDSYHSWNTNNQGLTGTVEYTGDGITYLDNGIPGAMSAFDVLGTPEPASTSLSAVGLTCLIALRRRKTS